MQLPMKQIALSLFVIAASGAYVWDQAGKGPADEILGAALPADGAKAPATLPAREGPPAIAAEISKQPRLLKTQFRTRFPIGKEATAAISAPAQTQPSPAAQSPLIPALSATPRPKTADPILPDADAPGAPIAATLAAYAPIPQPRPTYPDASAGLIAAGMKGVASGYTDGVYTGPEADAYYGIIQLQALVQDGRLTALKILQYPSDRRTSIRINRQALPMLRDEAITAQSANVDIISGATLTSKAFAQSLRGALKQAM